MKIVVGSDHAGFHLKEEVKKFLSKSGIEVEDFGTFNSEDPVDYPDYALKVAKSITENKFERGILICGTGQGMAISANKVPGIRATVCHDVLSANFARSHNDSNILTMGERIITPLLAKEIVRIWLETPFSAGRHLRRLEKIHKIEEEYFKVPGK